jgi:hypothetical protein
MLRQEGQELRHIPPIGFNAMRAGAAFAGKPAKPNGCGLSAGHAGAFSSQVVTLGGSENAIKQKFSAFSVNEDERKTH